ncbi:MAG: thrombospondin type 3 repeat-containing protein [Chthoniobacterales bacterium]
MKRLICLLVLTGLLGLAEAEATSTISPGNPYSYGANFGWMNWRASGTDGVEIGEYVCSGYIYGANVGWIRLGNGVPVNQIQYSNTSASDYGINYSIDPAQPGKAILRGFAYGANIGWVNFESVGNPRLRFSDGNFEGFVWSANCGWINLGNGAFVLNTLSVTPGIDTDMDGMADAFEFQFFGNLAMNQNTDTDGDGMTDLQEYLEGTSPLNPGDRLRITLFTTNNPGGTNSLLTWTTTVARLYQIEVNPDLQPNNWTNDPNFGIITPSVGATTSRSVVAGASSKRFYRVRAIRPLLP